MKSQNVVLTPNQILTKELSQDMKHWEELIHENVFGLGGHQDHLPASLAHIYSSHQGDDDEDNGASHSSTPSPTTYLNSLKPLDYQPYEVPTSFEQNDDLLFERQTKLLSIKRLAVDSSHSGRHCEEYSVRKRSENVE
ncbi:hypothetical protein Tco_0977056 [Tanacetum coccineum]|uniref:Uncharacterized protein n=1 Tax=Tanacetum coccineum TaxID=301880 RepID=A0ABQ5EJ14_9ASTR